MKDDIASILNKKRPGGLNKFDKPYKVLVVDDSSTMRRIICLQLKSEAYEICGEAADGKEAIELYKELDPDIVTLDINMPLMDGIETLKRLLDYDKEAKVVMLTSEGEKRVVLDAITMGARGYIVKPPKKAQVCEKVKQALEG
jgi:two-component system chemotaxis response regulator CheY